MVAVANSFFKIGFQLQLQVVVLQQKRVQGSGWPGPCPQTLECPGQEFSATDFINAEWADSLGHRISRPSAKSSNFQRSTRQLPPWPKHLSGRRGVSSGKKANNLQACLSKPCPG